MTRPLPPNWARGIASTESASQKTRPRNPGVVRPSEILTWGPLRAFSKEARRHAGITRRLVYHGPRKSSTASERTTLPRHFPLRHLGRLPSPRSLSRGVAGCSPPALEFSRMRCRKRRQVDLADVLEADVVASSKAAHLRRQHQRASAAGCRRSGCTCCRGRGASPGCVANQADRVVLHRRPQRTSRSTAATCGSVLPLITLAPP